MAKGEKKAVKAEKMEKAQKAEKKGLPFTSQNYLIGPREVFPIVGPTACMYNWRIDLTKKP